MGKLIRSPLPLIVHVRILSGEIRPLTGSRPQQSGGTLSILIEIVNSGRGKHGLLPLTRVCFDTTNLLPLPDQWGK